MARQRTGHDGVVRTVQRLAAYACGQRRSPDLREAADALRTAEALGFDRLLAEHRAAWAQRWEAVDVQIGGDPEAELALRFALFQLWCAVKAHGELAVGARGLSGTGYAGHVFWDADVFTLPALVTMDPAAAAAMVRYRRRRAPGRAGPGPRLRAAGCPFPVGVSGQLGEDVTPASARLGGRVVPILTGLFEEHVTAGVAWAAVHYARWAGRSARLVAPLLLETARYWASRCRLDKDGRAHIDGVIGPDEYHERVNDNAYTNVMARWNLRAAADAADRAGAASGESSQWRDLAWLVDGYDPVTGRYEQFAGYFGLAPLLIADVAAPPVAADLLLGRERVAASQLIKQPDVMMLHHLVPDQVEPGSLAPNLDYLRPADRPWIVPVTGGHRLAAGPRGPAG